jgi:signal transduction histidine kinase
MNLYHDKRETKFLFLFKIRPCTNIFFGLIPLNFIFPIIIIVNIWRSFYLDFPRAILSFVIGLSFAFNLHKITKQLLFDLDTLKFYILLYQGILNISREIFQLYTLLSQVLGLMNGEPNNYIHISPITISSIYQYNE